MRKLLSLLLKIMEFITEYKEEIMVLAIVSLIVFAFCYIAFTVSVQFGITMIISMMLAGVFICSENIVDFLKEKGVE